MSRWEVGNLEFQIFENRAARAQHPEVHVDVPHEFGDLLGGFAR